MNFIDYITNAHELNDELNESTYQNIDQVLSFLDMVQRGLLDAKQVKSYGKAAYGYLKTQKKIQKIK